MKLIHAVILGIIEGITEFLPISSTGHMILASELLGLTESNFLKTFEIVIQLGAILSVVVLYGRSLIKDRDLMQKVIVAFIPTGVLGLLLYRVVKQYLLGNPVIVVSALTLGGIFLILFEKYHLHAEGEDARKISYKQAALIGTFQSLAMVPGVSRSASTIIGGLILGVERKTIVEFSFLLAIPTMAAATGLDLLKSAPSFTFTQFEVLAVGFIVSFIVAILSIKFLLRFIQNHSFISFGVYRIAVGILFWWMMLR